MKVEDLMIGDWVIHPYYKHPSKIVYFNGSRVRIEYEEVEAESLRPIPLTPEILEKNGFYYGYTSGEEDIASNTIVQLSEDDKGWCWDEGCGAIKVIFPNEADGGLLVIDDQSFDRYLEFVYSATIYVHELQHAMRMCNINKTIEL